MAEVQSAQALISAGLQQAYTYQTWEYEEIFRRFLRPNSTDPDVLAARQRMLSRGIPEKYLRPECWDLEPERVLGAGNKTMEMAIAEQLLQMRPLFDPEPQRKILRDVTLAVTDDPARAEDLVPEQPQITDSIHDTELVFGSLMQGSMVTPKSGLNRIEVVGRMIQLMQAKIQQIMQSGGVGTPKDLMGLQLCEQYAGAFLQMMTQDKNEKTTARPMGQALGKLMNEVKGMAQRQSEMAQQAATAGNGHMDPKDQAKLQAQVAQSQAKMQNTRESHAQRTAQRQIQFEQDFRQRQATDAMDLQRKHAESVLDLQTEAMRSRMKNKPE